MTRDELLAMFAEDARPKVLAALDTVRGLAVYSRDKELKALAWNGEDLLHDLDEGWTLVGTYANVRDAHLSLTQQAMREVQYGLTPYAAAKKLGISPSAVYRAIRRADLKRCPCCGQTIKRHLQ